MAAAADSAALAADPNVTYAPLENTSQAAGESKRTLVDIKLKDTKTNSSAIDLLKDRYKGRDVAKFRRSYDEADARIRPMKYANDRLSALANAVEVTAATRDSVIDSMVAKGYSLDQIENVANRVSSNLAFLGDLEAEIAAPSALTQTAWKEMSKGGAPPPPTDAGREAPARRAPARRRAAPKKKRSPRKK